MKDIRHRRNQVYTDWTSRPERHRTPAHAETFLVELWSSGLRLDRKQYIHDQLVMHVIGNSVIRCPN